MNEEGLWVRCSKRWAICLAFGWGIIGGACAITMLVFAIIGIISPDDANGTDISGDLVGLCGGIVILGFVISVIIYLIWKYRCVVDIYLPDRMIRMNGKRQKYVLYYKNVVSTRQGLIGDFYIFCREPILLYGKQQGPTTLIEYYRKQDIYQIKRIIGNGNYNVY